MTSEIKLFTLNLLINSVIDKVKEPVKSRIKQQLSQLQVKHDMNRKSGNEPVNDVDIEKL